MFSVSKVVANKNQWHWYAENQRHQGNHSWERYSARGFFAPDKKVHQEADTEKNEWIEDGSCEWDFLPLGALQSPIQTTSKIASNQA